MPPADLIETDLLDPRNAAEAGACPITRAVMLPFNELPRRTHELPSRSVPIRIAGPSEEATRTLAWLHTHGWQSEISTAWQPADPHAPVPRYRLWRPAALVAAICPHLTPGRALDLGCGSGRDGVYLAAAGWEVTGVDILPDALERAADRALRYAGPSAGISWVQADLNKAETADLVPPASLDLVLGVRFFSRVALAHCGRWLRPGGSLLWETFTAEHRMRHGRPAATRVLCSAELAALLPDFEFLRSEEVWEGDSHIARVWAIRSVTAR